MAEKKTNKLIPIIAVAVIVLTLALVAKNSDDQDAKNMQQGSEANVPDGDTTADTLRTVSAQLQQLQEENKALLARQRELEEQASQEPEPDTATESKLNMLMNRVEELALQNDTPPPTDDLDMDFEIPEPEPMRDVWVEPIDKPARDANGEILDSSFQSNMPSSGSADDILGQSTDALDNSVGQTLAAGSSSNEQIIEPVYTIPKNSTFIGSTAMTALMGRVPINGTVEDPYPVKIIVGQDNLTANGHEIPEVRQMVFSGTATGDWTLSCVRADLTSVTYIFDDGTIQTLSVGDEELDRTGSTRSNRLAWISDNRGIPCVTGRRISNAASFLSSSIFAKGVEAGAAAVADAETTKIVNQQGDTQETVTGNAVKNAGYETMAGGAEAISEWLSERQQQNFDVIYRDTGSNVSIHIDTELPINFKPNGRKLRHARSSFQNSPRALD